MGGANPCTMPGAADGQFGQKSGLARHLLDDARYLTRVEAFAGPAAFADGADWTPVVDSGSSADRRRNDLPIDTPRKASRGLECECDRFRHDDERPRPYPLNKRTIGQVRRVERALAGSDRLGWHDEA